MAIEVITGNVYDVLGTIKDKSVNCCVTSPPYWNLRDYGTGEWDGGDPECDHQQEAPRFNGPKQLNAQVSGHASIAEKNGRKTCHKCGAIRVDGQLGSEKLHDCLGWATGNKCGECYICHMVGVFSGVKRVLRDDGVLWVNLGDSYASQGGPQVVQTRNANRSGGSDTQNGGLSRTPTNGLKQKDLCGIPWRFALAMQADGWYLRCDVVWSKPNPMPESMTDRPTKSHEYIFMFSKSDRYYYDADAIREDGCGRLDRSPQSKGRLGSGGKQYIEGAASLKEPAGRNKRSVWEIATRAFPGEHFAIFPDELPHTCILAACPQRVCAECGSPWERIVHTGNSEHHCRPGCGCGADQKHGNQNWSGGWQKYGNYNNTAIATDKFKPTCDCNADPVAGTVLDPFSGAGTTGVVCRDLGLNYIGIELNPEYAQMSRDRIADPDYEKKLRTHQRVERENKEQGSLFDV